MKLPETGFLRESQILPQREITEEEACRNRLSAASPNRPRRARPASPGLIPVSHATWWRGVKDVDIDQAMLKAIGYLPDVFHGLEFLWSMKPRTEIKKRTIYLTFWLPVAMTMEQIRKSLKAKKFSQRVDRDLFPCPDKLIITANPVFENGIVDSVPLRRGRCAGKVSGGIHDTITVLETLGPRLTKTFCSDGSVIPYGDAANFKVKPVEITGWPDLVKLLSSPHNNLPLSQKPLGGSGTAVFGQRTMWKM